MKNAEKSGIPLRVSLTIDTNLATKIMAEMYKRKHVTIQGCIRDLLDEKLIEEDPHDGIF